VKHKQSNVDCPVDPPLEAIPQGITFLLKRGNQPKLTTEKAARILEHIEAGKFLKDALGLENISQSSFYRGLERMPELKEAFKEAMEAQRSAFKEEAIATIRAAFKESWQAAAWWLERNYPSEFGRVRHEFTGADGGPILLARGTADISDAELTRLIAEKQRNDEKLLTEGAPA
jgi:hypothetical protein